MSELLGRAQEFRATRVAQERAAFNREAELLRAQKEGQQRADEFMRLMETHRIPKINVDIILKRPETWITKHVTNTRYSSLVACTGWVVRLPDEVREVPVLGMLVSENHGVHYFRNQNGIATYPYVIHNRDNYILECTSFDEIKSYPEDLAGNEGLALLGKRLDELRISE